MSLLSRRQQLTVSLAVLCVGVVCPCCVFMLYQCCVLVLCILAKLNNGDSSPHKQKQTTGENIKTDQQIVHKQHLSLS